MRRISLCFCLMGIILSLVLCSCGKKIYSGTGGGGGTSGDFYGNAQTNPYERAKRYKPENAQPDKCGANAVWSYDAENKVLTISGTGDMWDFRIGGYTSYIQSGIFETDVPWNELFNNEELFLEKIVIEEGITHIGDHAFYSANLLTCRELYLPKSLTSIGDTALCGLNPELVVFPENLEYIGAEAFSSWYDLETVQLPETVEYVGDFAFGYCDNLEKFYIGEKVKYLGKGVLSYCVGLESVEIHESNRYYRVGEDGMLYDTSGAKLIWCPIVRDSAEITVPEGVTEIGAYAFAMCNLDEVVLPSTLKVIGEGAFTENEFAEFVIPEGIREIKRQAFCLCQNAVISVPSTVKLIENQAFFGVKEVTISDENMYYCMQDGIIYDKNVTKPVALINPLAEYRFPDTVTEVSGDVLDGWEFDTLTVPESVKSFKIDSMYESIDDFVYEGSFEDWYRKGSFIIADSYTFLKEDKDDGSIVGGIDEDTLIRWKYKDGKLTLMGFGYAGPISGEWIEENGYLVKEIELKEGIKGTSSAMFEHCPGFETIKLPETLDYMPVDTFLDCTEFRKIRIPSSVVMMGNGESANIFEGCSALEVIEVDSKNKYYASQNGILYNKDGTEVIACPESSDIRVYRLPSTVKKIGAYAFSHCSNLETADLSGAELYEIGEGAFKDCFGLTGITFGDKLINIGAYAFAYTDALQEVVFNEPLEEIGESAFLGSGIKEVTIPSTVKKIGKDAFNYCSELEKVTFGGTENTWKGMRVDVGDAQVVFGA